MAKVQYPYIRRKKSESGQTGTVTYDLPEKGVIPEIVLRVFSTPTASTSPALPINDAITKVEIVDGSKVIKSLTGNQLHALEMIHRRHQRCSTEKNDNGVEGYDDFLIPLGGNFNGVEYAPDFSRFNNPQIKISWDYSLTTDKFGCLYDSDGTPAMKFTVMPKIVREGGKYTHGYVKSSDIYTWTSAASTTTQTEIPRGEKLLGLMIEAGYVGDDWTEQVQEIKLDFDNGAWVPIDIKEEEIVKIQEEWFTDPFCLRFRADMLDTMDLNTHMGWVCNIDCTPVQAPVGIDKFEYPSDTQGIGVVKLASDGGALATYSLFSWDVQGFLPYQCWYLPVSKILDGDGDTVDTTAYGRIILETVSGSTANTAGKPVIVAEYLITD